ncbi:MAG: DUF2255 family protein [Actinomycetota bacterium]|nr:DUF2255 family protein [Actinomycetota bacterium]
MSEHPVAEFLGSTQTVAIITTRSDGTEVATPIWAVTVDGIAYIRSFRGRGAGWFRRAISGRPVAFSLEDGTIAEQDAAASLRTPRAAVLVHDVPADQPIHARIDAELRTKYARWPEDVAPMVVEPAIGSTLRITPA